MQCEEPSCRTSSFIHTLEVLYHHCITKEYHHCIKSHTQLNKTKTKGKKNQKNPKPYPYHVPGSPGCSLTLASSSEINLRTTKTAWAYELAWELPGDMWSYVLASVSSISLLLCLPGCQELSLCPELLWTMRPHTAKPLLSTFQSHARVACPAEPQWACCASWRVGQTLSPLPCEAGASRWNPSTLPRTTASPTSALGTARKDNTAGKNTQHPNLPNTPDWERGVHFPKRKFILLFFLGARTKALATRAYTVGQELTPPSWCPRSQLWHATDQDQNPPALFPRGVNSEYSGV